MPLPTLASSRQAFTRQRRLARGPSRGFFGPEQHLQTDDLIPQDQAALLQPAKHELIGWKLLIQAIDPGVQIGMLNLQFDQAAFGRM
jgi:hypothetical protein